MKAASTLKRKQLMCAKRTTRLLRRKETRAHDAADWIRELASPYLKGYQPVAAQEPGLQGYWFLADAVSTPKPKPVNRSSRRHKKPPEVGFFVGYLVDAAAEYSFLHLEPPECVVFAWISPAGSLLHKRLVRQPGSLVRKIFEYIRWLTHRPPRFVFHEAEAAAMTRHASMAGWPQEKRKHLSRNFFIEALAWLVRSGLVKKLKEEVEQSTTARAS
ncbi:MAG: hypothetical protein WA876_08105 [Candidatus Acidiferrales bacterium]